MTSFLQCSPKKTQKLSSATCFISFLVQNEKFGWNFLDLLKENEGTGRIHPSADVIDDSRSCWSHCSYNLTEVKLAIILAYQEFIQHRSTCNEIRVMCK